jgi:hypothetical protein
MWKVITVSPSEYTGSVASDKDGEIFTPPFAPGQYSGRHMVSISAPFVAEK